MVERQREVVPSLFSRDDLERIEKAIRRVEKRTSGEIRVIIGKRYDAGVASTFEQARLDFNAYRMWDTREKTGVLILVLAEAREFAILADSGIHAKYPQAYWDGLAKELCGYFTTGEFAFGIVRIVEYVGEKLALHFPRALDDVDELPNSVVVKEV